MPTTRSLVRIVTSMHGADLVHYDFKGPNCLLDPEGHVKIADFGLSLKRSGRIRFDETKAIDNAFYKAPEIATLEAERRAIRDKPLNPDEMQGTHEGVRRLFPSLDDSVIDLLTENVLKEGKDTGDRKNADLLTLDQKVDAWGLGASALELFTGTLPFQHVQWNKEGELQKFAKGSTSALDTLGAAKLTSDDKDIDGLLNGMLASKPANRLSPRQVLASDPMKAAGVGSDEARALILALRSGDAGRITTARHALRAVK